MPYTAVKINDSDWSDWLDGIYGLEELNGFECESRLFLDCGFRERVQRLGLNCLHVRELLPLDAVSAYRTADATHSLHAFFGEIYRAMSTAWNSAQTQVFSLPPRLDRIDDWDVSFASISSFLEHLLKSPMKEPFKLLLPVRLPRPFPESKEQERSIQLCNALRECGGSGELKLILHLYPEEKVLPDKADALLNPVLNFTHTVCFHYSVPAQETLFDDEQEAWAKWFGKLDFAGQIVFCPDSAQPGQIPEILRHVRKWASFYHC